jgi:hypothetical protein
MRTLSRLLRMSVSIRACALITCGLAVMMVSCASASKPKLVSVTGSVFYGDKPAAGASVVFVPAAGIADATLARASGIVADDGSFTLATHPHGAGAIPGEYVVVLTWYEGNARAMANPKSKLPAKYADAATTTLKATVQEEDTVLQPFKVP